MKILNVIHGYPMRYNAGSEVYTQTLCHSFSKRHEVHVFTREENAFSPDFHLRTEADADNPDVTLHLVNNPRLKDCYRVKQIDQCFAEVLDNVRPDVVHVGHLNHLSTSLLIQAKTRDIPIVFTLHDYWLMCPRGQFMQMFPEDPNNLWKECSGQENRKCAERCYSRYFSGAPKEHAVDVAYWEDWVDRRMKHIREMADLVDLFIAPSRYLHNRYRDEFGLPEKKLVHLDYGFSKDRMNGRDRANDEWFVFGYIGTHIPAKGIHDLIQAFGELEGEPILRIWGRPRGQDTESLKAMAAALPNNIGKRVEWLPEYRNQHIVLDVFNRCDAIVVPSVWVENSPLVIHEAQQVRVPVITADVGGMAEFVEYEVNGLLFNHRSTKALAEQMQRFVDNPESAKQLGARGYLHSASGDIMDIEAHAQDVERLYSNVIQSSQMISTKKRAGPWRITVDTNPDTCNLKCIMCEEHSPHSPLQLVRRAEKLPRRLMPFEMIEKVVADAAPHGLKELIPSTMGEPLLYEHFEGILELCKRYDVKMNLTTNGTFPRIGASAWAEKIVPYTSDVKISWNGSTKKTYERIMLGAKWDVVLGNVREFITVRDKHAAEGGNRCRVTFQLTFLESNVRELADMVRLAIDLGVDRVKGHHLWAHFGEIEDQSMRKDGDSISRWNHAVTEAHEVASKHPLSNGQYILLENIFPLDENSTEDIAPGGACPFLGQEAWVSAKGRFDPCCAPDAQRRTLGDFGSLHDKSVMDIWNSDDYQELVSNYSTRSLCMGCNMRKPAGDKQ